MCEPLRDKVQFANWENPCFRCKDVKSAVAFYKKYEGNWEKLLEEKPEIYSKWNWKCHHGRYPYNNWLFDYCFGDVTDE